MAVKKKEKEFAITVSVSEPIHKIIAAEAKNKKRGKGPQCAIWLEEKIEQLKQDGQI